MERKARDVVAARVRPEVKAALPLAAQAAGYKNVCRYLEQIIEQALLATQAQQEPTLIGK